MDNRHPSLYDKVNIPMLCIDNLHKEVVTQTNFGIIQASTASTSALRRSQDLFWCR